MRLDYDTHRYHPTEGGRFVPAGEELPGEGWFRTPTEAGLVGTPGPTEHEKIWVRDPDLPPLERGVSDDPEDAAEADVKAALVEQIAALTGKRPHPNTSTEKLQARLVELQG